MGNMSPTSKAAGSIFTFSRTDLLSDGNVQVHCTMPRLKRVSPYLKIDYLYRREI